jgi:hypothetical protein
LTDQATKIRFWKASRILVVAFVLLVTLGFITQRTLDGPVGPIPGGKLRGGDLVSAPVSDWTFAHRQEVELQLVEPVGSRTVVTFAYNGDLYVPVPLGFFARRVPDYPMVGHLLRFFKRWHLDALRDGRVVLRLEGKLYERQAERVTDLKLLAGLTAIVAQAVAESISSPLIEVLDDDPEELWFFRLDPR